MDKLCLPRVATLLLLLLRSDLLVLQLILWLVPTIHGQMLRRALLRHLCIIRPLPLDALQSPSCKRRTLGEG